MLCIHSCVVEHKPNVVWCSVDVYWTITANITWLLRKLGTVYYVDDGQMPTIREAECVCAGGSANKINQTSVFSTILEDDILYYARQLWSSYYTLNTYGVDRYRYDNLSTSLRPETNCNKAAALRLYRRRLRLRHDTSQMYHNNTQQQRALNSIAMRR